MVLNFCMCFKNGLKAQKLLAQGVWGKLGEVLFLFLLPDLQQPFSDCVFVGPDYRPFTS